MAVLPQDFTTQTKTTNTSFVVMYTSRKLNVNVAETFSFKVNGVLYSYTCPAGNTGVDIPQRFSNMLKADGIYSDSGAIGAYGINPNQFTIYNFNSFKYTVELVSHNTSDIDQSNIRIVSFVPSPYTWVQNEIDRTEPDRAKKLLGWIKAEKPARQWFNWLFNQSGNVASALDSFVKIFYEKSNYANTNLTLIGEIRDYAGAESGIQAGWALCDGSVVPASSSCDLFRAWVDAHAMYLKDGDGVYRFPDLRGRVCVGAGFINDGFGNQHTFLLGNKVGEMRHPLSIDEMPTHTHEIEASTSEGGTPVGGFNYIVGKDYATQTTGSNGSGMSHNNMQPYFVTNKIIRVY